jgi:hypothetical protein
MGPARVSPFAPDPAAIDPHEVARAELVEGLARMVNRVIQHGKAEAQSALGQIEVIRTTLADVANIDDGSYWVPGWWEEVWVACLRGLCDSRRGRREPTTRREDPRIWRYRIWSTSWH